MAVNFCHEYLGTRILCSQVSTESHEVDNLISSNLISKNRGFLAGSFVRPPVDIIVQFPCPVKICCLSVNGRVGCQQSTGCEVLIQNEKSSGYDAFNYGIFHHLGKYFWDCDKRGVSVVSAPHSATCKSSSVSQDFIKQEISSRVKKNLSAVWSLRIRIIKTSGSSIPALGGLSVWGYVAYSCPAPLARIVLNKWHSIINQPKFPCSSNSLDVVQKSGSSSPTHSAARTATEDDFEIPEEFLDGLTCEIMAMPVRLPSGNVIDERTLERFAKQEASWGRPMSDPFTAQAMTASSRRPVYDTALKARIDSFLLKESHRPCLINVPRTTGPIQTRSSDTLLHLADVTETAVKRPITSVPSIPAPPQPSVIDPSRRWLTNVAASLQHLTGSRSVRSKNTVTSSSAVPAVKSETSAGTTDCLCGIQDGRLVYSLPCCHHICRPCLLESKANNTLICRRCRLAFALHEPVLYHSP